MDENKKLFEVLDSQSKVMVGVLMRKIEILDEENALQPSLIKQLIKEQVYECFRNIKCLLTVGEVVFTSKEKKHG